MVKIGLIGCGRIAQIAHLDALTRLSDATVVALADRDRAQLDRAAEQVPEAATYTDYEQLLADSDAEAVLICLPSAMHAEGAIAAFEAGKHVYIEKPMATTLEDAQAVLAAQERAGTVGAVGFNFRFGTMHQQARQHIQSGSIGDVAYARTTFTSPPRALKSWKQTRAGGGGALLILGSHHVDLVPYLLGQDIEEVYAEVESRHSEDDTATLHMRTKSGTPVQCFFSMSAAAEDRIEVYGEAGKLMIDRFAGQLARTGPTIEYSRPKRLLNELKSFADGVRRLLRPHGEPTFGAALGAFVRSIETGQVESPTLRDGYRSLAVIAAAEESAAQRAPVPVDAVLAPASS